MKKGIFIQYAKNSVYQLITAPLVFIYQDIPDLENKMSTHFKDAVKLLFIDEIDNQNNYNTLITVGSETYYAFTEFVKVIE